MLAEGTVSWIREDPVPADARWAQANIIRRMSIDPPMPMMKAVAGLNRVITFGGSTLSRAQEELIATTVSTINRCRY